MCMLTCDHCKALVDTDSDPESLYAEELLNRKADCLCEDCRVFFETEDQE